MKKYISIFFCILLLMVLPTTVLASVANNTYKDTETGLSFEIPIGWTQEAFKSEKQYLDVKFCDKDNNTIMYGSDDLTQRNISIYSEREIKKLTIDDLTNEDIKNIEEKALSSLDTKCIKTKEKDYDKVKIGDKKYLRFTFEFSVLGNNYKFIPYFYVKNGTGYTFAFSYDATQSSPIDIEEFLNNVKYPEKNTLINEQLKIFVLILTVICYLIIPLFIIEHRKKSYSSYANILIISTLNFIIMIISFIIVPSKFTIAAALICGIITYHIAKQNHNKTIKKETITITSDIQNTQNKPLQCQDNVSNKTNKNEIVEKNNDENDIEVNGKNNVIQNANAVDKNTKSLENINDKLDKLDRLVQLKKLNTISDAEFELLKKEILGE